MVEIRAGGLRKYRRSWGVMVSVLVLLCSAVAALCLHHRPCKLATVQEGQLYRSGFGGIDDLHATLDQTQVRTVVALLADQGPELELLRQEQALCRERGIKLVQIPLLPGAWPHSADIHRFLEAAESPGAKPVLVHCSQGVRRTGMMAAAYQLSILGFSKPQAKQAVLPFGHEGRSINDILRFIDLYDPRARTIPDDADPNSQRPGND